MPEQIRHYGRVERPYDYFKHYERAERDYKPLYARKYAFTPTVRCIDPPYWECRLPFIPRDERAPATARIETLPVTGGDSVTFWAGRDPSRMRLVMGFDAFTQHQRDITEELAFWRRVTGPGPDGKGIRVQLNFGEGQDQAWWVEQVEVTNKERRGEDKVVAAVVTADLIQAISPVVAFTPAEQAKQVLDKDPLPPRPVGHK